MSEPIMVVGFSSYTPYPTSAAALDGRAQAGAWITQTIGGQDSIAVLRAKIAACQNTLAQLQNELAARDGC